MHSIINVWGHSKYSTSEILMITNIINNIATLPMKKLSTGASRRLDKRKDFKIIWFWTLKPNLLWTLEMITLRNMFFSWDKHVMKPTRLYLLFPMPQGLSWNSNTRKALNSNCPFTFNFPHPQHPGWQSHQQEDWNSVFGPHLCYNFNCSKLQFLLIL